MSVTQDREPYKLSAGILAVAVHGVFFGLLYFGFSWQTEPPATMSVELWQDLPDAPAIAKPAETPVEPAESPQPDIPAREASPQPAVDTRAVEAARAAAAERAAAERVAAAQRTIAAERKAAAERAAAMEAERAAAEARVIAAEKAAAAERAAAAVRAAASAREAQRAAAARAIEQAAAAERAATAERRAASARTVNEYIAKIKAKIRSRIVMPPDVPEDVQAIFEVTLLPDGSVMGAPRLRKSSGIVAYDNAVERAILKAQPLPLPPDPVLFDSFREMNLKFQPKE